MSSATSTEAVRLKPDTTPENARGVRLPLGGPGDKQADQADQQLHPWQFFVLAALGCATAAVFVARGQGFTAVILLSLVIGATALVGIAALRTLRPLVSPDEDRTAMFGDRTRAALEREKMLALRSIKELEFDRAMGKLSESDWREMSGRLRARATRLMRQLDAGAGYREQIERDLAKRLAEADARAKPSRSADADARRAAAATSERSAAAPAERSCTDCATVNDADARFCKGCGNKLE